MFSWRLTFVLLIWHCVFSTLVQGHFHWILIKAYYVCLQVGALDSQDRDVPRYTEKISKLPVLVQAGHSALSRLENQTVHPVPNRVPLIGCRKHRLVFGVQRDIPACESSAPIMRRRVIWCLVRVKPFGQYFYLKKTWGRVSRFKRN